MSSRDRNLSAVPKQEQRLSAEEYRSIAGKPRRNKFGARKTVVGGITFDSKREAEYYAELKLREKAGEVHEIELQPEFRLIVNGNDCGRFRADFRFFDALAGRNRVVDIKGFRTREFNRAVKLVKAVHGIDIEIVK